MIKVGDTIRCVRTSLYKVYPQNISKGPTLNLHNKELYVRGVDQLRDVVVYICDTGDGRTVYLAPEDVEEV